MDKLQGALNTIQAVQGISGRHNVKVRKKEDMTAKSKKYQAFAQAAYKDSEENVKGYELLKDVSPNNDEIKIYRKGKKIIIASRGTANIKDVKSDLVLAQGKEPARVAELKAAVQAVKKRFALSNSDIKLVGHSLAGYTSGLVGHELGIESHIFNPGSTTFGSKENQKKLSAMVNSQHVHTSIIQGDPVSAALLKHVKENANIQVIDNKASVASAHGMANFEKGSGIQAGGVR